MFFILYYVLKGYTSCDCAYFIYNKHLKTLDYFCNILDELMTKQYNANLAKETSYYLITYTLHIHTGLKMVRTSLAF
jgi:hypothetical protein